MRVRRSEHVRYTLQSRVELPAKTIFVVAHMRGVHAPANGYWPIS